MERYNDLISFLKECLKLNIECNNKGDKTIQLVLSNPNTQEEEVISEVIIQEKFADDLDW